MIAILVMLVGGLALSFFFSGSETGFYRVSRVRLLIDALDGNFIADKLLTLVNHPTWFVATTLVGNNVANYLVSLAIVLTTERITHGGSAWTEVLVPVAASPFVFVLGELLPKSLFFLAPNRLLRLAGGPFCAFALLFSPISLFLGVLGKGLERLLGESPQQIQLRLARRELYGMLEEGHAAGILLPTQRTMAQSLVTIAPLPVGRLCVPIQRATTVRLGASVAEALRVARVNRLAILPVRDTRGAELVGYVRVIDLALSRRAAVDQANPLLTLSADETRLAALMRMQAEDESIARVVDQAGRTIGLLHFDDLARPLFRGETRF